MHHTTSWKQSGSVPLWHYTENQRNYPGCHLTADADGCASLFALLDALVADAVPAFRTVAITAPSKAHLRVPNNRSGSAACRASERLRVACSIEPGEWSFPLDVESSILTVGADWVPRLRDGIAGIAAGRGDYSIGQERERSARLWFW